MKITCFSLLLVAIIVHGAPSTLSPPPSVPSLKDIELIEFCRFERQIWKSQSTGHICKYIIHTTETPQNKTLVKRIEALRALNKQYREAVRGKMDCKVLQSCYLAGESFSICLDMIRQYFGVLGHTEASIVRLQFFWDRFVEIDKELAERSYHEGEYYHRC